MITTQENLWNLRPERKESNNQPHFALQLGQQRRQVVMAPEQYCGCTHMHQRQMNDAVPILGANIAMLDEHQASVRQTKSRDRKLSTNATCAII